jgi:hypothetical protein
MGDGRAKAQLQTLMKIVLEAGGFWAKAQLQTFEPILLAQVKCRTAYNISWGEPVRSLLLVYEGQAI